MKQCVSKHTVKSRQPRRLWLVVALLAVLALLGLQGWQFVKTEFMVADELAPYNVGSRPNDDTLRVAIIGDSWAEYHHAFGCDTLFEQYANRWSSKPVRCFSKGKGGAMSKEVYHYMFQCQTQAPDLCTQPLIEQHPDYCVVMTGINDTWKKRPVSYYTGNYRLIIRLLLANDIRPVVMEIPDFEMGPWLDANRKSRRRLFRLYSYFTGVVEDDLTPFRNGLRKMLMDTGLKDSVLFIPCSHWLPQGHQYADSIYQTDHVHLTRQGYHLVDSCMARAITREMKGMK